MPTPMTDVARAKPASLQARIRDWMVACFGAAFGADKRKRCDRFLEEALELLQSVDYPKERVAAMTEYVWNRPAGEPRQEVAGVMLTLAGWCLAHDIDMHAAAEDELARVWTKVEKIRAKEAAKPEGDDLMSAVYPDIQVLDRLETTNAPEGPGEA